MDEKTIARFWSKVDRNGPVPEHVPHIGNCWVWTGSVSPSGYGQFSCRLGCKYKCWPASRVSLSMAVGDLGQLYALHRCDNRRCVRQDHLFPGTHADNVADAVAKGRLLGRHSGPNMGNRKWTDESVRDVFLLRLMHPTLTSSDLSRMFGMDIGYVHRILAMRSAWRSKACLAMAQREHGEGSPRMAELQALLDAAIAEGGKVRMARRFPGVKKTRAQHVPFFRKP